MNCLLLSFALATALCSCQNTNNNTTQNLSVIEESNSIITEWFGENHFNDNNTVNAVEAQAPPPSFVTPAGVIYQVDPSSGLDDPESCYEPNACPQRTSTPKCACPN